MQINAEELQRKSLELLTEQHLPKKNDDVLLVRRVNHWREQASLRSIPLMLYGKFWHQGEVCILYADSNLGKSIVAVQIADAISRGNATYPFNVETQPQPVIYCDFELTDKQFEARY